MGAVLADLWPLYGLKIVTPGLELRLPREEELAELARIAGEGVHRPDERPFLTPWTEGSARDRELTVLQDHWGRLAGWAVDNWRLGLGVFRDGQPLGLVTLRARNFPVVREVTTSSWLGLEHHGKGYGTLARIGLLTLAFDHLGAVAARTEVFQDNHASQGVSRKLGYEPDGISRDARGDEVLVSDRLRLTAARFASHVASHVASGVRSVDRSHVVVIGMAASRPMFGLEPEA
jgi:RimJ/RimL family protein N-acetyltransferase